MTLVNLKVEDTGYYSCEGSIRLAGRKRFVYVASGLLLIRNLKHCDLTLKFSFSGFSQVPQNLF
jgi:hypothetical protein